MSLTDLKNGAEEIEAVPSIEETHSTAVDRVLSKKLVRKIDWQLIPILFFLLMAAFLDRINIGNARLLGLEEDLNMKNNDFNIALFIFFIPYILCEVPANICLKKLKPSVWLSGLILGFGKAANLLGQESHVLTKFLLRCHHNLSRTDAKLRRPRRMSVFHRRL